MIFDREFLDRHREKSKAAIARAEKTVRSERGNHLSLSQESKLLTELGRLERRVDDLFVRLATDDTAIIGAMIDSHIAAKNQLELSILIDLLREATKR